ncbi:phosphoglucomutase/phosphomannomutase family protein [Propioniciclava soli]|uniref:phosphoglucomutase/phosphomannomutase family protein n=1 Tax=Propioniciclava soli TaxID=2775081 RepID=UPI001E41840D|nr:phosphoglucomutase/phosphomannomutase family protein [Propioniciclava soli]
MTDSGTIHFGTGGWREIIGDGFTRANVRRITQALCDRMAAEGVDESGVVVGHDRRFLSLEASRWVVEVLLGNGIPVTLIERPAPTPMFMWTVRNLGCAYGLAVTASHNPALYNGIKVFTEGGRDAEVAVTDAIAARANALGEADIVAVAPEAVADHPLLTVQMSLNWYLDAIIEKLDMETIRHRHLHIVLDPMFGVAQTSLQTVLMTARCQVDVINDRHDALFGGRMPSPTAATLEPLKQAVLERKADLGIATDGDADRLGIIDDTGAFLHPNQILVLLYHYLLTTKGWHGPAVRNMSTTHLLDRVAQAHGEVCHEVPVGFKWISAKMDETDAVIGGESSGGLTVRGHIAGKDGVYAGSLLVEMVAASGKKLSELYADILATYGRLEMVEAAYSFAGERKAELEHRLFTDHDLPDFGHAISRVRWDDGCKVYFANDGWVTIRFSGTEPVLRVFCEMPTLAEAEQVSALVAGRLGLT